MGDCLYKLAQRRGYLLGESIAEVLRPQIYIYLGVIRRLLIRMDLSLENLRDTFPVLERH